jgi:hypothetical protein
LRAGEGRGERGVEDGLEVGAWGLVKDGARGAHGVEGGGGEDHDMP